MAGYPGTIASSWQRGGPGGAAAGHLGGRAGGLQRAARSVHCRAPGLLLRALAGARLHQSRESRDPAWRIFKCAAFELPIRDGEKFGKNDIGESAGSGRSGISAPFRRRLALDVGHLSGGCHQPALGRQRQFRGGGHHRRAPRDRGGSFPTALTTLHEKAILPARSAPVPGGALRLRRAQGLRQARRFGLLHRCHRLHAGEGTRGVRGRSAGGCAPGARRRAREPADRGFRRSSSIPRKNVGAGKLSMPEQECTPRLSGCIFRRSFWRAFPHTPGRETERHRGPGECRCARWRRCS